MIRLPRPRRAAEEPASGASGGILILNWRCPSHPEAGGAERYAWELATGLVGLGHEVTFFASRPPGLAASEVRDGVCVARAGGTYSLYLRAAWYLLRHRRRFTAVIDCQNGIPFFAPLFLLGSPTPVFCLIHHVHQDQFLGRFGSILGRAARFLEGPVSRVLYMGRPIVAVSPSTRTAIRRRLGFRGPVYVIPNGHDVSQPAAVDEIARAPRPTVLYLGRLVDHKQVHLLLEAAGELRARRPELRVEIVGNGPARQDLEQLRDRLGLQEVVRFRGYVSDRERYRLLRGAWVVANPSLGEGWGLTVIEANAAGRPVLAFRVPGLLDSIVEGTNGWLVGRDRTFASALAGALTDVEDAERARAWERRCRSWASLFSWGRTIQRWVTLIDRSQRPAGGAGHASDVATVVTLDTRDPEPVLTAFGPGSSWQREGSSLSVLYQGLDLEGALRRLEESGAPPPVQVRVARTIDFLCGPVEQAAG